MASTPYNQDGLATSHNSDFMRAPDFQRAYAYGLINAPANVRIEWRVHVALWAASCAVRLPGDFVECGVHTGILSGAVMDWIAFEKYPRRRFYLFDTWNGIPLEQISEAERRSGVESMNRKYENGDQLHQQVLKKFARWPNAVVVRGRVPDTLSAMSDSSQVAYASIDMNVAEAEMDAIDFLWPRIVPGGMVLLDDYGWAAHQLQKEAWDAWALGTGVSILSLPTGQGLIIKPLS